MYEHTGIHDDLMQIKRKLKINDIDNKAGEIEDLKEENYKLKIKLNDLYSLNKKILREIASKHYKFTVPVTRNYAEFYANTDLPNYEMQYVTIPLDEAVIEMFKSELFNILENKED